jgi:DNA replication protein DnaC
MSTLERLRTTLTALNLTAIDARLEPLLEGASKRFVHEASHGILLGPPGVGKTHLAVALAETAIQSGRQPTS